MQTEEDATPRPEGAALLEGAEFIRIILQRFEIDLEFDRVTLQVGSTFVLQFADAQPIFFIPERRFGDLTKLWSLVGQKVARLDWVGWTTAITLHFDGGASIRIPPVPRGTLLRKDAISFEDF